MTNRKREEQLEIEELWEEGEKRMNNIGPNGNDGDHYRDTDAEYFKEKAERLARIKMSARRDYILAISAGYNGHSITHGEVSA